MSKKPKKASMIKFLLYRVKSRFRSVQVHRCWVCGALTNLVFIGGWPGCGVRMCCPQSHLSWHHLLEEKIKLLQLPHPQSYGDELGAEIAQLKIQHQGETKDDLVGDYDLTQEREVTNVRSEVA